MMKTDEQQNVIDAWRSIKDPNSRKEVVDLLYSLLESAAIEKQLNIEREQVNQEINSNGDGDINSESKHFVKNGDVTECVNSLVSVGLHADLVFTSPPYNANIKYDVYDDSQTKDDYIVFLENFIFAVHGALKPGGRFVINLRDVTIGTGSRFPIIVPLYNAFNIMKYTYRGLHIWYKGREESSFSWGSFKSSNNPAIIDLYEYVFVFQKPGEHQKGKDNMCKTEFIENVLGIWKVRPTKKISGKNKKNVVEHPCPFPVELAKRVIKLYSHVGDTVFDPFAGVMNTAIAAAECGRNSISVDISEKYCNIGAKRFASCFGASSNIKLKKL